MFNSDEDDRESSDSETAQRRPRPNGTIKQKRLDSEEDECKVINACEDLVILGLPFKLEESELRDYFSHFGEVARFEVCCCCVWGLC